MAHIVIEHSSNLRERLNLPRFIQAIHEAALATGIFHTEEMRTRAFESSADRPAEAAADSAFIHLSVRVGHGRDLETRRRACEDIFAAACEQVRDLHAREPFGISVEMQEQDPDPQLVPGNIRDYDPARPPRPPRS